MRQQSNKVYRGYVLNWNSRHSLFTIKEAPELGAFLTIGQVRKAIDDFLNQGAKEGNASKQD
jgi:hypothetical protein